MTQLYRFKIVVYILLIILLLASCYSEDYGPIQHTEKEFSVVDFDRIEVGDAMHITVRQGDLFHVEAEGDRRNIDDLIVEKNGSTLRVRFDNNRSRRHTTEIEITMPTILSADLSGATDSRITDFADLEDLDIRLTGASVCQLDANAANVEVILSGASYLYMHGTGEQLEADLSGASVLKAFNYPVNRVTVAASGASDGNITVSDELVATATGASVILYRGTPTVTSETSGSSTVKQD